MNNISSEFSIKDLENLSGIKAHTIRIWEKRYGILEPERTESNIRLYNLENLKKLLNVTSLYNAGFKISKIAKLDEGDLHRLTKEEGSKNGGKSDYLGSFILSMINFDQQLFESTYNRCLMDVTFREIFLDIFVPLMFNLGLQWQSNAIIPAHEHFITSLIKQKLFINIEKVQQVNHIQSEEVYVLYLPENEIHDLGLMYINYELSLKEKHCIYLGQSVPSENLSAIQKIFNKVHFITYFTVYPLPDEIQGYVENMWDSLLKNRKDTLSILGRAAANITQQNDWNDVYIYNDIKKLIEKIPENLHSV